MNVLYSWERDSLEGTHDAEAMERSTLKRKKNRNIVSSYAFYIGDMVIMSN